MEFLFIVGAIGYYIYKVYQETQKRNNQSTTPINKPKKKTAMQSIEDLLKEIEQKSNPQQKKTTVKPIVQQKPRPIIQKKNTVDTLNYDDVFTKEGEVAKLEDKYKTIMDFAEDIEEDNIYAFDEIDDYDSEHTKKHAKKSKVLNINGNQIKAKDAFVYSLIFDRKY